MEINSKIFNNLSKVNSSFVKENDLESFTKGKKIISQTYVEATKEYVVVYKLFKDTKYETIIHSMVREKYKTDSEEFAILRKGIANPNNEEFVEYNTYVEEVKKLVKAFVEERGY